MTSEIDTTYRCPACNRRTEHPIDGICTSCEANTADMLIQIVGFRNTAETMIEPGRSGSGRMSSERTIGVNVTALSYATNLGYCTKSGIEALDRDGLGMLHEWERLIREERQLTPVALVPYAGSCGAEVKAVARFLLNHLPWAAEQTWATEMVTEVSEVHRAGQIACKAVPARRRYMTCPGDLPEGGLCENRIPLPDDFADYIRQPGQAAPRQTIYCNRCLTTWTIERLVQVALSTYGVKVVASIFGRDMIASYTGVTRRHVNRLIATA